MTALLEDKLYNVRCHSQTDEQWRNYTVAAPDEDLAAAIAMRREQELVDFSLQPKPPVQPERPDSNDATVLTEYLNKCDRYNRELDSYNAIYGEDNHSGEDRLQKLVDSGLEERSDGKIVVADGKHVNRRAKAHFAAHILEKPYVPNTVELVIPSVPTVVSLLKMASHDEKTWQRVIKEMKKAGIPTNVTGSLFGLQMQKQLDGSAPIVWSTATLKVMLSTSTFVPNQDTLDFANDVTNELAATGNYVTGGFTLGTKTSNYNSSTDQAWMDAADVVVASATFTARIATLYSDTAGASSTDPLWGWVDFITDQSPSAGTFSIVWDATGIVIVDVT